MANTTTILNRLISALTSQDPSWDVGIGTAEYKILEAVANELSIAANNNTLQNYSFDINTKFGSNLDAFCSLFGIYRNYGKRATGTATFSTESTGLTTGTLDLTTASLGTFTASYNGTPSTAINVTSITLAKDTQSALTQVLPAGSVVNVSGSFPILSLTFTPPLTTGSINFDFSGLTVVTAPSWTPQGGAASTYEIPMGTQIFAQSNVTNTGPLYFQTTVQSSIPQGSTQVQVPIQATLPGSNGNLTAGAVTSFATTLVGITQVTNSVLTGGTDPETDAQLRDRWNNTVFKNLAGTEDQFRALALSVPTTTRVKVLGPQEQNTENLQIQTLFKLKNKYKTGTPTPTVITSTNNNDRYTFQLYASVTLNASWALDSSVWKVTVPSGTSVSGIYTGMNVFSGTPTNPTYYIPVTMLMTVSSITSNTDGTTTIALTQDSSISVSPTASSTAPITFCVPATLNNKLTNSYDPTTTTIQSIQDNLNYTFNGTVINDVQQLITLSPVYNSAVLYLTAGGGHIDITYTPPVNNSQGPLTAAANYDSGSGSNTAANVQYALNSILNPFGYQAYVTPPTTSFGGFTYSLGVDFYQYPTPSTGNIPIDVNQINKGLVFGFSGLTGGTASGFWSVPTGLNGTVSQLAYFNLYTAKPLTTNLSLVSGRIDDSSFVSWSSGTPAQINDSKTIDPPDKASRVFGPNIPASSSILNTGYSGNHYFTLNNSLSSGLGGAGVQLVFPTTSNPYIFLNYISATVPDSKYFYPQGLETVRGTNNSGVLETASFTTDYSYSTTDSVAATSSSPFIPATLTISMVNGSNHPWLYPGSIVSFTYYYVASSSRNIPVSSTISTNYVDIMVDGVNPQLVSEDVTLNNSTTDLTYTPGSSGQVTLGNQTNWVLGDGVTYPPVGDIYYIFGQQPVVQPVFGLYPQKLLLTQVNGNHANLQAYSGPVSLTGKPDTPSEPTAKVVLRNSSTTATVAKSQMAPIYYKQNINLPEQFSGIVNVKDYSRTNNTITTNLTSGSSSAGTFPSIIFNSDFYPIYDNTTSSGSTQAMNGIGIRQPKGSQSPITVISSSGPSAGIYTWTFTCANSFVAGQRVYISGCTPDAYNGNWVISSRTSTQFTLTTTNNPTILSSPGGGTVFGVASVSQRIDTGCTITNGSKYVVDANITSMDIGQIITGTNIPIASSPGRYTRIASVNPGVGFTMTDAASVSGTTNITVYTFCQTPVITTGVGDQLFNLQYYIDADVVSTENLIQQQRLLGVSTQTHLADYKSILVNLVVVLDGSITSSTATTNINTQINNYFNLLGYLQPIQISSIIRAALSVNGVINARIATSTDSSVYYGIQTVAPFTYFDAIQDLTQGSASNVDFRDIVINNTYTGDVSLGSNQLPQLFRVNVYTRSQSDF